MRAPTGAELRLIGSLKTYVGGRESVTVETSQTVRQALAGLGVRPEIIALVIVNGTQQAKDYVLKDGDRVELLAVIGGGCSSPNGRPVSDSDEPEVEDRKRRSGMRLHCAGCVTVAVWCFALGANAQPQPRSRDLGVPFDGTPGPLNAITDVKGVEVGHATIISGDGPLKVGVGPIRTGVTAVLPRGKQSTDPVFAGWFSLNGNGEMTGTTWVEESGFLEGPVMITNTHSVGVVRDAVIKWRVQRGAPDTSGYWWSLPVVAETWDGYLNDTNGFHVKEQHVFEALSNARSGPVAEGSVGGGTGMICHGFKGGIGTSSRKLDEKAGGYSVGVLVQANHGTRGQLRIAGVPVGRELLAPSPEGGDTGSIIIVVASDAPLLPHQLKRLARRASLGIARNGAISGNGSGDIFIAFSTANPGAFDPSRNVPVTMVPNGRMDRLFEATVQATEESVINALVAARTMTGADNHTAIGLPHDRLREILKKYNRLVER